MHVLVTCKYKKGRIKSNREKMDTIFSIISQWGLPVAMDTRVLIQSASKHYAFPTPSDATQKIWSRLVNWPTIGQLFKFESVKFSSFKGK